MVALCSGGGERARARGSSASSLRDARASPRLRPSRSHPRALLPADRAAHACRPLAAPATHRAATSTVRRSPLPRLASPPPRRWLTLSSRHTVSIRPDASPERPSTPIPDLRTNAATPLTARASLHPSPRLHSRTASTSPSPSLARWRETLAAQLEFIQRRPWPRAFLGRGLTSPRAPSPARPGDRSAVEQALRRGMQGFAALWIAQDDDPASAAGPAHLHGDDDLVPSSPALGGAAARSPRPGSVPQRIPPLSRLGQLVVAVLLLLGLRELVSGPSSPSRRARTAPPPVQGRNPFSVLADLAPPAAFSRRYSTHLPGSDSLWKTSAAPVDAFTDARDAGDTTAVVLHWKRTDNVGVIVAHLCQYTFFETVLVWNNNPDVVLSPQVRRPVSSSLSLSRSSLLCSLASPRPADVRQIALPGRQAPHLQLAAQPLLPRTVPRVRPLDDGQLLLPGRRLGRAAAARAVLAVLEGPRRPRRRAHEPRGRDAVRARVVLLQCVALPPPSPRPPVGPRSRSTSRPQTTRCTHASPGSARAPSPRACTSSASSP